MKIERLKGGHLTATFQVAIEGAPIELSVDLPLEDADEAILRLIERATEHRPPPQAGRASAQPLRPLAFAAEADDAYGYVVLTFRLPGGAEQRYSLRADAAEDFCDELRKAAAESRNAF